MESLAVISFHPIHRLDQPEILFSYKTIHIRRMKGSQTDCSAFWKEHHSSPEKVRNPSTGSEGETHSGKAGCLWSRILLPSDFELAQCYAEPLEHRESTLSMRTKLLSKFCCYKGLGPTLLCTNLAWLVVRLVKWRVATTSAPNWLKCHNEDFLGACTGLNFQVFNPRIR